MASQTTTTKYENALVEPRDNQLRKRLGFDRRGIRREFASVNSLDLTDKRIRTEDRRWIDPRSVDLPYGPTGMGETGGSGMEMYIEEGDQWQTYRFTHGFNVLQEDLEASNDSVAQQRDEVIQIFDFFADSLFMTGVEDEAGNQVRPGMLEWIKSAIPSSRTFDCTNFDGDTGEEDYRKYPSDLLNSEAYGELSGEVLGNNKVNWDTAIMRQETLAQLNQRNSSTSYEEEDTMWENLTDQTGVANISDFNIIPPNMEYPYTPDGVDPLSVDLTQYLGTNEMILLPDLNTVSDKYWSLDEMDSPRAFDLRTVGAGEKRQDYAWRYNHRFNPDGRQRWAEAEGAVHIKNVDAIFS